MSNSTSRTGEAQQWTALLPMKGHSERIPEKNVKPLGGKPLCLWVLKTLDSVRDVERVVVNTDSEKIADLVADHFEVTIHWRPDELCGGEVSMNRIIAYDLELLEDDHYFVQTHATNPFLRAETLERALRRYRAGLEFGHDSVFSVTRHQSRFYDADGRPLNHEPGRLVPTQDLPPLYEENSNFYIFSRDSFESCGSRIGSKPAWFEMDPREATDIDEPRDWQFAETLLATPSIV